MNQADDLIVEGLTEIEASKLNTIIQLEIYQ